MSRCYEYHSIPWLDNAAERLRSGRVLVRLDGTQEAWLDLYNCYGHNLPAYLLHIVLKMVLPEDWLEKVESYHQSRLSCWTTDVSVDPWTGDKVYRLYAGSDNNPVCSSAITISASGLTETFSVRSEDIAPLLQRIVQDYPPVFLPRYRNYRYTYCFPAYPVGYRQTQLLTDWPHDIKKRREEIATISVDGRAFNMKKSPAGRPSGLSETIEALKCLEVFLA